VQAARVALTEIGAPDPAQLPVLVERLGDARDAVRCGAASSIAKLGPEALDAVPMLMRTVYQTTPMPACFSSALGQLTEYDSAATEKLVARLRLLENNVLRQKEMLEIYQLKPVQALKSFPVVRSDGAILGERSE